MIPQTNQHYLLNTTGSGAFLLDQRQITSESKNKNRYNNKIDSKYEHTENNSKLYANPQEFTKVPLADWQITHHVISQLTNQPANQPNNAVMTSMFFRLTHWLSGSPIIAPLHSQQHIHAARGNSNNNKMCRKKQQNGTLRTANRKTALNHAHKMHIWWCHAAASRWRARAHQCFWKLHLRGNTHTHSYASTHTREEAIATPSRT